MAVNVCQCVYVSVCVCNGWWQSWAFDPELLALPDGVHHVEKDEVCI